MFESFGEASRLYAKNYAVIEAVRKEFEHDVNAFLDGVRDQVSSAVLGSLREKITKGYRYWWIGEGSNGDRYPQLWFESTRAEIVCPGELKLTAIAPTASPDQVRGFVAIGSRPEFSGICQKGFGGTYSLFTAVIRYENDDPVQRVSGITARLLGALNEVYAGASHSAAG